jgi:yecA family protein
LTDTKQVYVELDAVLSHAATPIGLAEFHGSLCAALCVGGAEAGRALVDESIADWSDGRDLATLVAPLTDLREATWRSLAGTDMSFEPFLPDEDEELDKRVAALSQWCHGFVSGLGLAGYDFTVEDAAGEIAEIVGDLTEISRATHDAQGVAQAEQADNSLTELVEYVRVSVQIVYEELGDRRGDRRQVTVH